ncbi:hypothetical protein [Priestia megaterium]|uniref:hypothetical protein n=1 Tax=Priestia megaterium TaxID=1404 RepID=UPI00300BF81E
MFTTLWEKIFEMAGGDNYEKLINFLARIANMTVDILMSILIIAYSFQSVMMLSSEKILIENEFYLTHIEKYINMANKFALIGPPIFNTLMAFGGCLLVVSCCVWKILNLIGKGFNLPFFSGVFLIIISLFLILWSMLLWCLLWVASLSQKYFIFNLSGSILLTLLVCLMVKKLKDKISN